MKKNLLLLTLIAISLQLNAQDISLTANEKNAIDVLKATLFMRNRFGGVFLDHHQFKYERQDDGKLKVMSNLQPGITDQMYGDRYQYYLIEIRDNGTGIIEMYDKCERDAFIRLDRSENGRIVQTASRGLDDGKISYDGKGRIVEFDMGRSYSRSGKKKVYKDTKVSLSYDAEGRLNGTEKFVQVYKKSKSAENLKKDYTTKDYTVEVIYGDKKIQINQASFRANGKKRITTSEDKFVLTRSGNETQSKRYATSYNKKGEARKTEMTEKRSYKDGRLASETMENDAIVRTRTFVYDDTGNITSEHLKVDDKIKNELRNDETTVRVFDADGFLKESTLTKIVKGNTLKSITTYTYKEKDGKPITPCVNKKEYLTKHYNEKGELFKESTATQVRVKENGVWGEWKHFQY